MNYKMTVRIANPNTDAEFVYNLDCNFCYAEYGNGHYACIRGKDFYSICIDMSKETSYDQFDKVGWLAQWARRYWNGRDGSWELKAIEIEKVED